jgi:hypothetical protein
VPTALAIATRRSCRGSLVSTVFRATPPPHLVAR